MPHVVTQACCGDASCVFACPVNCIHPTPDEPDFATAEMLYIDPRTCVDCGACVSACPVGAIAPHTALADYDLPFADLNAVYHAGEPDYPPQAPVPPVVPKSDARARLSVAVVGAGPAGLYAADELLKRPGVEVTVYDRLPTPYGLVRAGVAPDHPDTRSIIGLFAQIESQPGFHYRLGVRVGQDVTHDELASHHHAVLYATGAANDRRLDIPGEELPGSHPATSFVAWYNGHPDHADATFDLDHERAVVVGTGNVALDVARILATDPELLAGTDVAEHALAALRRSRVREVVLLGRRGAAQAAFTLPELYGLLRRDDIEVVAENVELDPRTEELRARGLLDPMAERKVAALESLDDPSAPRRAPRRIVLSFRSSPQAITGARGVDGVEVARNDLVVGGARVRARPTGEVWRLDSGLVLRSIGYHGTPVADLPFDERAGVVPNQRGRVLAREGPLAGTYVAGWIKRGPTGFIGTNRSCARETVDRLFEDFNAGALPDPPYLSSGRSSLARGRLRSPLPGRRPPGRRESEADRGVVGLSGWRAIDREERARGRRAGRMRSRLTDVAEMREVAATTSRRRRVADFFGG